MSKENRTIKNLLWRSCGLQFSTFLILVFGLNGYSYSATSEAQPWTFEGESCWEQIEPTLQGYNDKDSDGLDDNLENCLAEKHAPVLQLNLNSKYNRPASVEWYLPGTRLRFNHWNLCNDDRDSIYAPSFDTLITQRHQKARNLVLGCDHTGDRISSSVLNPPSYDGEHHFFLEIVDSVYRSKEDTRLANNTIPEKDWKTYVHSRPSTKGIDLEYWYFFPYNDPYGPLNHEGDWENIVVRLDANLKIYEVIFVAHGDEVARKPNKIEWLDGKIGERPIAYIADGSHGTYESKAVCDKKEKIAPRVEGLYVPLDTADSCVENESYRWFTWAGGKGERAGFQGAGLVQLGELHAPLNGQTWIGYSGRWGEIGERTDRTFGLIIDALDRKNPGNTGPTSPYTGDSWMLDSPVWLINRHLDNPKHAIPDDHMHYRDTAHTNYGDLDKDGIPNGYEIANNLKYDIADSASDFDKDGLSNFYEFASGWKDQNYTIDADGNFRDSAGQRMVYNSEFYDFKASIKPYKYDTDGDGMWDGDEIRYGFDPIVPDAELHVNLAVKIDLASLRADIDNDGIEDLFDTDLDQDGVNDAVDLCLDTPVGKGVGTNGCNSVPLIWGTPEVLAKEGFLYLFAPSASDPDRDDLTFSITNKPSWITFDSTFGYMYGTPGPDTAGEYSDITITVTDNEGLSAENPLVFSILVTAPPTYPINMSAVGVSDSQINITWDESTDASGNPAAGYEVFLGDEIEPIGTSTSPGYTATGLIQDKVYSFRVRAFDNSVPRIESLLSESVAAKTLKATNTLVSKSYRVSNGNDDAEERANGSMYLDSSDLELSDDGSNSQKIGIRFTNIQIPKGATIQSAHLEFMVDEYSSGSASITIKGETTAGAAQFSSVTNNISTRPLTAASVDWNNIATWDTLGVWKDSPDISNVIQEIVNLDNWTPGHALALIISGSGTRTAESYSGNPNGAATLVLKYIDGPSIDLDSPSAPSNLSAMAINDSQIDLNWTGSTDDDSGVAGYHVYRDGGTIPIATVKATGYSDVGVIPGTAFDYVVTAFDYASPSNESVASNIATATTPGVPEDTGSSEPVPGDVEAPSVPTNLRATPINDTQVDVRWDGSVDIGGGMVAGYNLYRDGLLIATITTGASYYDTGLEPSTKYSYTVSAFDNASPANISDVTMPTEVTTLAKFVEVNNLIAHWSMDQSDITSSGRIADLSGNGNDLHMVGVNLGSGDGIAGDALNLNGNGLAQTIDNVAMTEQLTVSAWVYQTDPLASTWNMIVHQQKGIAGEDYFFLAGRNDEITWYVKTDEAGNNTNYRTGSLIPQGQWVHLAGVYDGSTVRVYRDGVEVGSGEAHTGTFSANKLITVGGAIDNGIITEYFTGMIDEVRIYDRPFSAQEIANLADSSKIVPPVGDIEAPNAPIVSAVAASSSQINLSWTESIDIGGGSVAGYEVFLGDNLNPIARVTATRHSVTGLIPEKVYSFSVRAFDNASPRNDSTKSDYATAMTFAVTNNPIPDNESPSTPQNLQAFIIDDTQIELRWNGSVDIGGGNIAGYNIYRDGVLLATVPDGMPYLDTGLTPVTSYVYTVEAFDDATPANTSLESAPAFGTTLATPIVSNNLLVNPGFETGDKSGWSGSGYTVVNNIHSGSYGLRINGVVDSWPSIRQTVPVIDTNTYRFSGWLKVWDRTTGKYMIEIRWFRADGTEVSGTRHKVGGQVGYNTSYIELTDDVVPPIGAVNAEFRLQANVANGSAVYDDLSVIDITASEPGDTLAPDVTTGVIATVVSDSQIDLSWSAAVDNGGGNVAGYDIYLGDLVNPMASVATTSHSVTGLDPDTVYSFTVVAFDNASPRNESAKSASVAAKTSIAPGTIISQTYQVANGNDDAEEGASGSMYLTSSDLELVEDGSTNSQLVGMRFTSMMIPKGATIANAYLEFQVDEKSYSDTNLTIRGEALAGATSFSTVANNISSRTLTTANVAWNSIPGWDTIGVLNQSPDISSVIQEIVDLNDWSSGQAMVIVISGSGHRVAESYNGDVNGAPKLIVEYIDEGPTGDADAPSIPLNLTAVAFNDTQIDLTWDGSVDIGGGTVAGYKIYRDGVLIDTVPNGLPYSDTDLTPNTAYVYTVLAFDNAPVPNESLESDVASATTLATPVVSNNLLSNPGFETGDESSWTTSGYIVTGKIHTGGYALRLDGVVTTWPSVRQTVDVVEGNTYRVSGWMNVINKTTGSYMIEIRWYRADGTEMSPERVKVGGGSIGYNTSYIERVSEVVAPVGATGLMVRLQANKADGSVIYDDLSVIDITAGTPGDTLAPDAPTGLTATTISESQIDLSWDASVDNGGGTVAGYLVYQGDATNSIADISTTSLSVTGLNPDQMYSYTVKAYDNASPRNVSGASNTAAAITTPTQDVDAPSIPQNLSAVAFNDTRIDLTWDGSVDIGGGTVAGYKIYRDGVLLDTVPNGLPYSDTGLTPNTAYVYTVSAFDNAPVPNESLDSNVANATTLTTPVESNNLLVNPGFETGDKTGWSGSGWIATSNMHSGTYALRFNANPTAYTNSTQKVMVSAGASYQVSAWLKIVNKTTGSYSFQIRWYDVSGSRIQTDVIASMSSNTAYVFKTADLAAPAGAIEGEIRVQGNLADGSVIIDDLSIIDVTTATPGDTLAPDVPTGLTATTISESQINLAWNAATDNGGGSVAGYLVYQGDATNPIADISATSLPVTGLNPDQMYSYTVKAYDNASPRNVSGASNTAAAITTPTQDVDAPSIPQNLYAVAYSDTQIDLTWNGSVDLGGGIVAGYHVYRNGSSTPIKTVTNGASYSDKGLTQNTSYVYTVSAFDNAPSANESLQSTSANATTLTPVVITDNLVVNPGFETGDKSAWISSGTVVSSNQHSGTYALKLTGNPDSWPSIRQEVPVVEGNSYEFRGWLKVNDRTAGSYAVQARWYTDTGAELSSDRLNIGSVSYNTDYIELTKTLVAPANAVSGMIRLQANTADGFAHYDDLSIVDVTPPAPEDTLAPNVPTGLMATTISESQIDLAWNASTDNGGGSVAGYLVYQGDATNPIAEISATSLSVTGLSPNQNYSYKIAAFDNASPRNVSAKSSAAAAITLATQDVTPPPAPTGLAANAVSETQINLSWTRSVDDTNRVAVAYRVYRDGNNTPIDEIPGTSYSDISLQPNTSYVYTVKAVDDSSNVSLDSTSANATTLAAPVEDPGYCAATSDARGSYPDLAFIQSVGLLDGTNWHSSSDDGAYGDHTLLAPFSMRLGNYTSLQFVARQSLSGYNYYWKVWIDYNKDSVFDANELAYQRDNYNGHPVKNFLIPATALAGETRMRVIISGDPIAGPCGVLPFGEIEDHTVNLQ